MALHLTSPAFEQGGEIPKRYTCDGDDVSPPLRWRGTPDGTRSFVLLCNDRMRRAARSGTGPPTTSQETGSSWRKGTAPRPRATGCKQAINDFGKPGYAGPCPPRDHGAHLYHFRLMALSEPGLPVAPDASCAEVEALAGRHVFAETELVGTYQR